MSRQTKTYVTPEEYLALERQAEYKSEYYDGEIFAMTGASEKHNLITLNIASELRAQFKKRDCKTYSSDMRAKVPVRVFTPILTLSSSAVRRSSKTNSLTLYSTRF